MLSKNVSSFDAMCTAIDDAEAYLDNIDEAVSQLSQAESYTEEAA